ncbi:lysylphosphatidylglycerol synthase domain-containing protein [Catenuloplanes indicus]|uniref:Uncharacterized protein n=1 Tax=Catenuloplanes indicus TaxID=137267 RepID=A0AAE3VTD5_9ACTN|nr:lysylphosphatidylglycerol synthase domain-containing protein [Catenuloplanes indicus]MDQ0363943.1 hypothetical protein [Catenuloplanes indicus]
MRTFWWVAGGVFSAVVVIALARALAGQDWSVVGELAARDSVGLLTASLGAAVAGPVWGMLSWRVILLALGPPVGWIQVLRVFFVGFLAKYVPGKVPGMLAAVKVATANGVTAPRMIISGAVGALVTHLTGLTLGLLAAVQTLGDRGWWLVPAAIPVAVALVRPQWPIAAAFRVLRRPVPDVPDQVVRVSIGWQIASWLVSGVHVWLLAVAMGADPVAALPLCVGGFALATVLGVLAFVVPDGIGVREVALTGALALVLPLPAAVTVAVASRLVTTLGEVVLGGLVMTVVEVVRWRRSAVAADPARR